MAEYYSIITNRGKELEAEALASGSQIILTQFVVGDSNGKPLKPDPAQTQLVNETYRGDIAELVVSPDSRHSSWPELCYQREREVLQSAKWD